MSTAETASERGEWLPEIHLSQLLRAPVLARSGEAVGRVEDVIVRLRGADDYPLVTGIVTGVGGRRVFIGSKSIDEYGFNPESAGGLMNVDFVCCAAAATAGPALALIADARTLQPEALVKIHVLDEDKRLVGVVSVIALLQANPGESVGILMDSDPVRVSADADLTDIALLMADFNLYSIPVVDEQDRVLGVVTVDDVLEATIPEDWRRREPAIVTGEAGAPVSVAWSLAAARACSSLN